MSKSSFVVPCHTCNKQGSWGHCIRCRTTFYCSPACQKADWKEHKLDCEVPAVAVAMAEGVGSGRDSGDRVLTFEVPTMPVFFTCMRCKKEGNWHKCEGCKITHYCSKECQTKDWPRHKASCRLKRKADLSLKNRCAGRLAAIIHEFKWIFMKECILCFFKEKRIIRLELTMLNGSLPKKKLLRSELESVLHPDLMTITLPQDPSSGASEHREDLNEKVANFKLEIKRVPISALEICYSKEERRAKPSWEKILLDNKVNFIVQVHGADGITFSKPCAYLVSKPLADFARFLQK